MIGRRALVRCFALVLICLFVPAVCAAQPVKPETKPAGKSAEPAKSGAAKQPAPAVAPSKPAPTKTPAPAPKPQSLRIAFFQLEAQGVEAKVSSIVSETILAELRKLPDTKVIGSKEIDAILGYEEKKQMAGCTDASCAVNIGGALGVDKIVMGTAGKLGDSFVFNLKLIEVKNAAVEGVFNKRLKGGKDEDFLDLVADALALLFPANAALWAKTDQRPTTYDKRQDTGKTAASLTATAEKQPEILPWIVTGVGAALVVAGGVTHYLAFGDHDEWSKTPEANPQRKSLEDSAKTKQTAAFVLYGVGAATAAGGLVWYYLTPGDKDQTEPIRQSPGMGEISKPGAERSAAPGTGARVKIEPVFVGMTGVGISGGW